MIGNKISNPSLLKKRTNLRRTFKPWPFLMSPMVVEASNLVIQMITLFWNYLGVLLCLQARGWCQVKMSKSFWLGLIPGARLEQHWPTWFEKTQWLVLLKTHSGEKKDLAGAEQMRIKCDLLLQLVGPVRPAREQESQQPEHFSILVWALVT